MYDHLEVEKKWQKYWADHETFKTDVWDFSKPKFYALDMFPYPSGVGLHACFLEGYTAGKKIFDQVIRNYEIVNKWEVLKPRIIFLENLADE